MQKKQFQFLQNLTEMELAALESGLRLSDYAIFDNAIDKNLIKTINDSGEELSDELFFKLLDDEPAYLATALFQKRISEWQEIPKWPELYEKEEVNKAKSKLQKIGRVLAKSSAAVGSPEKLPIYAIRIEYNKTIFFLKKFFSDANRKPSSNYLVGTYPEWKNAFKTERGRSEHWSLQEIALRLTLFRLSERGKNPIKISLKRLRQITK